MSKINFIINYLKYRIKARNAHYIHSPFVFNFYNDIINDSTPFYIYDDIESIRKKIRLTDKKININDFGAGSKVNASKTRKIKDIAKHTLTPPKHGQLLFRLVNRFKPQHILELGTSLGITTLYLATPNKNIKVTTVEGCTNTAKVAQINFDKIKAKNIDLVNASFDDFLHVYLRKIERLDMVFFDGNHRKEATINYFTQCVNHAHNESIFIFDDIYWSKGMMAAWEEIKNHPQVTTTIDIYFMGIIFFNKDLSKENFVLKF